MRMYLFINDLGQVEHLLTAVTRPPHTHLLLSGMRRGTITLKSTMLVTMMIALE